MSPFYIRLLVLLLIFVSVILSIEALLSWVRRSGRTREAINRRLSLLSGDRDKADASQKLRKTELASGENVPIFLRGWATRLSKMAIAAKLPVSGPNLLTLMALAFTVVMAGGCVLAAVLGHSLSVGVIIILLTFSASISVLLPLLVLARLGDRRRRQMADQFPVALDVFVRGLRAGHPVAVAIEIVAAELPDPIGSEFGLAVDEMNYGADLRDVLQAMADRWDIGELHMFVTSLSIQSETGGNLSEILENLARVIRERASMYLKVRALSSEGRMTALILTALPVFAFCALFLFNPRFYLDVAADKAFAYGFGILIGLYLVGFISIRRMINLRV